jgi:hypothetical protein
MVMGPTPPRKIGLRTNDKMGTVPFNPEQLVRMHNINGPGIQLVRALYRQIAPLFQQQVGLNTPAPFGVPVGNPRKLYKSGWVHSQRPELLDLLVVAIEKKVKTG